MDYTNIVIKAESAFDSIVPDGWRLIMTIDTANEVMECPEWDYLEDWTPYTFKLCERVMQEEGINWLLRKRAIMQLKKKRKEMLKRRDGK